MSLKFPISLVGKRVTEIAVPALTSLYSGETLLVELEGDIPNNWNDNNTPYNADRLEIGSSCTSIGSSAFNACTNLTGDLVIPDSVTTIGDYAFNSCTGLTSLTIIGNSVTTIESSAFSFCSGLTTLVITNSVTTIEFFAFLSCTNLTTAYLAPSLANVSGLGYSFQSSGLTTVYAKDAVANGWTVGAGQTVGGKTGVTVAEWTNYPNPIP